jgi:hypothetical protein
LIQETQENSQLMNSLLIAGIGLLGVILGIITSNIISWKLKSKESRLRILEKIFDKRLNAHEEFLSIPKLMRTTVSSQEIDEKNYFITYPIILDTKENIENFSFKFYESTNFCSHWFEENLRKEIFFAQDYFQNVTRILKEIPEENCQEFAKIIKTDFKEIADNLEEKILDFLLIDIHKINLNPKNRNFTYSKKMKKERLENSKLITKWEKIQALKK